MIPCVSLVAVSPLCPASIIPSVRRQLFFPLPHLKVLVPLGFFASAFPLGFSDLLPHSSSSHGLDPSLAFIRSNLSRTIWPQQRKQLMPHRRPSRQPCFQTWEVW